MRRHAPPVAARLALVLVSLASVACSGSREPPNTAASGSGSPEPTASSTIPGPSVSAPPPAAPTSSASPSFAPSTSLASLRISLRRIATGLDSPIYLTHAGSSTLYVVEQSGRILRRTPDGSMHPYLDIRARVGSGGERGLLGLAFHPRFASNGRLFVDYTNRDGDTRVSEFRGSETSADPASERALLSIDQPYANHNGGMIEFDRAGMLLIATGDGGSGGDPHDNGQSLGTLLGKILRIDVDSGSPYGIPSDNPFRSRAGAKAEIYEYGLRNPWRFSLDRQTGDLWIGDVGQGELEEIDFRAAPLRGGTNFGWRIMEGRSCYNAASCDRSGLVPPVAQYGHGSGDCAVTGGYVYRGSGSPSLRGFYFYADSCSGFIRALSASDARDGSAESRIVARTGRRIVSFGQDAGGELFVVDIQGSISRITQ